MSQPGIPPMPVGATRKRNVYDVLETLGEPNKTLLIRVDFNVPMDSNGNITDDSRIRGALPTIQCVIDAGCNAVLCSHMGRPKLVQAGADDDATRHERQSLSLKPIAEYLGKLLNKDVVFVPDCLDAKDIVSQLSGGQICVLENLRFYKKEEKNDPEMAQILASYADAYINDAFGTAHRAHASTHGVPACMEDKSKVGIGILVASELAFLDFRHTSDDKITAIIGGSKVSTKLPVIQGLLSNVDNLILGGGLAFTFLKAKGINIGTSLVEEGMIDTAKNLLEQAEAAGKKIFLPVDAVCAQGFPKGPMDPQDTKTFEMKVGAGIEEGWMGLDCGAATIDSFKSALAESSKICFNGPMGVFEIAPFDQGTRMLVDELEKVTRNGTITVVGGGDSVAALAAFDKTSSVTYVSTGGGATLELLAGDKLPGVEIIPDYEG
ncbi:hypothetical protein FisN_7Hh394 [Fistulifera solaris]|uniref:Phosphoglycerate kinase n=1 Tax=Fistulifera solaris TaxID=1519565 RepID=A0A1Z5KSD9_FISSO|nr:hypothetical protein FisN_7Hh394 [Fistulifera solaris]|eukprot:GAX29015.1 hypothetical protein FisN_7Hh394 [Fistulifera solaris]